MLHEPVNWSHAISGPWLDVDRMMNMYRCKI